jgi:bifunctional non-homologous end joining protein LigD
MAAAAAARDRHHAARRSAPARQPLRIAAGAHPGARVRPELVPEVRFLTWTEDNLLRQVVYEGLREDKPASEVRREHRQGPQPVKEARPAHGPAAETHPTRRRPSPAGEGRRVTRSPNSRGPR